MTGTMANRDLTVVAGIGATGLSVARYLAGHGRPFVMVDSRVDPPGLRELATAFPEAPVELGEFNEETLCSAGCVVVSPGLSLQEPALRRAVESGVPVTGDIQLFADQARAPVVAITGTNGKSTVTTLVGRMAQAAGLDVGMGGNLGTPALDLLDENRDLYVLELSSFQLELVDELGAAVAAQHDPRPHGSLRWYRRLSPGQAPHLPGCAQRGDQSR